MADEQLEAVAQAMALLENPAWVKANPEGAKGLKASIRAFKVNNPQYTAGGVLTLKEWDPGTYAGDGPTPVELAEKRTPGVGGHIGAAVLGVLEGATGVTRESSVGPRQEAARGTGGTGQPATSEPDIAPELQGTQWEQNLRAAEAAAREEELAQFDRDTRVARIAGNVGGVLTGAPALAAKAAAAGSRALGAAGALAPRVLGGGTAGGVAGVSAETPEELGTSVTLGGLGGALAPSAAFLRRKLMPSNLAPMVRDIEGVGGRIAIRPIRQASAPAGAADESVAAFNKAAELPMSRTIAGGMLGHVGGMVTPTITPAMGILGSILINPQALSARGIALLSSLSRRGNVSGAALASAINELDDADKAAIDRILTRIGDSWQPKAGPNAAKVP